MMATERRPAGSWLTPLVLVMVLAMASPVGAQGPGGGMGGPMGGGGMGGPMGGEGGPGPGGGKGRKGPPRFDLRKAATITGQVEDLGSYGLSSRHSLPGMTVQGLVLKTEKGDIEVYLGPPAYLTKQKFTLQKNETLEIKGFKGMHQDKPAFFAAKVKKKGQTLDLLDEQGMPLWTQEQSGGPGSDRAGRGGRDSGMMGGGPMGGGMMEGGR